jgi:hypothetical protein
MLPPVLRGFGEADLSGYLGRPINPSSAEICRMTGSWVVVRDIGVAQSSIFSLSVRDRKTQRRHNSS